MIRFFRRASALRRELAPVSVRAGLDLCGEGVKIMTNSAEDRRKLSPDSKRCPACGEVKPVSEFYSNPSQRDGLDSACRPCHIARRREYRRRNLAYERERQRLYERARYWRRRHEALLRSAGSVRDDVDEAGT